MGVVTIETTKKYECPACLRNRRLICLDIETTGLDILFNTIIELGIIEYVDGVEKQRYSRLFGGGHSSMYLVRKIHHIKDASRRRLPTFKDCADKISNFLSNSCIITHNGTKFDIPMIEQKLSEVNCKLENCTYIDTFLIAKKLVHDSNSLEALAKQYNLEYGGHRGLGDAETTLQLLFCLIEKNGSGIIKF